MKDVDRRDFLRASLAGAGALALGACRSLPAGEKLRKKPLNFLFILVDDLGWRDLGCFGSTFYETPHIDALCARGMKFTQAYAACPVCSPTRASIMAGKYPARMDTTDYFGGPEPENILKWKGRKWRRPLLPAHYLNRLPLEEVTLAEAFKEAGYATFFAGKWHLGHRGYYPEDQGFEVNKGGFERGGPYGPGKYFVPYGNPKLKDGPPGEYLPFRLAKETARFIEAHKDGPFLAYLAFYSVHIPLMTKKGLEAKYAAKAKRLGLDYVPEFRRNGRGWVRLVQDHPVYAGMVEAVDIAVGRVLEALDRNGLRDNTAVIFMSDNGGLSTAQGWPTSNAPLRAGKGWLYEGGIREPMFIVWPGVTKPGSVCKTPVISTDFYPTMLEMAGLPLKPKQHVDGVSLVPLLKGGKIPPRPLFWHYPHYGDQGGRPGGVIRDGDWKLIEFFGDEKLELYNLRTDIGERHDLSRQYPEKVKELLARLKAWRKSVDAKMPRPNPAYIPGGRRRP